MANLKLANIGGVSPVMPSYSDVTPRLSAPPTINPGTYGSSSSGSSGSSGFNLGSLLGSVGSPLGWAGLGLNFANSLFNKNSAEKAQELQLQMFREQLKFNHDEAKLAFERESRYNSEVAQVQRMIQAGLNPALMFKGANSVNSSSASAPASPDIKYPLMDTQLGTNGIQTLLGSSDLLSRNESNLAMINQLNSLSKKYGVDSRYQSMLNDLLSVTFDNEVKDKQLKNAMVLEQIENYKQERALMAAQTSLADTEVQNFVRKLGIEESKVAATIRSAILNSSALRYSADQNLIATKYNADKHQETEMAKTQTITFNDYQIAAERNGIERGKAKALAEFLDQERQKAKMETYIAPIKLLFGIRDSEREGFKDVLQLVGSFVPGGRAVVSGFR